MEPELTVGMYCFIENIGPMNFQAPHRIRLRRQDHATEPDVHRNSQNKCLLYRFYAVLFNANSCSFRVRHGFWSNKSINYRRLKPPSTSSSYLLVWSKASLCGYPFIVLEIPDVLLLLIWDFWNTHWTAKKDKYFEKLVSNAAPTSSNFWSVKAQIHIFLFRREVFYSNFFAVTCIVVYMYCCLHGSTNAVFFF